MNARAQDFLDGRRLDSEADLAQQARAIALETALEAELVWPGLTALVTVQSDGCDLDDSTDDEVCREGEGENGGNQNTDGEDGGNSLTANCARGSVPPLWVV